MPNKYQRRERRLYHSGFSSREIEVHVDWVQSVSHICRKAGVHEQHVGEEVHIPSSLLPPCIPLTWRATWYTCDDDDYDRDRPLPSSLHRPGPRVSSEILPPHMLAVS